MSSNETARVTSRRYSHFIKTSKHATLQSEIEENSDISSDEGDSIDQEEQEDYSYEDEELDPADYDILRQRLSLFYSRRSSSPNSHRESPGRNKYDDYRAKLDNSDKKEQTEISKSPTKSPKYSSVYSKNNKIVAGFPLKKWLGWIVFLVTIGMGCYWLPRYYNSQTLDSNDLSVDPAKERIATFRRSIRNIKEIFPGQTRRSWSDIESGIIEIMSESEKPWTIVLFSNTTNELSCLAKMLGKASSEALHSDGSLELHPKDLGDDYGLAIDHWKPQITAKKAVIVHDLLNINPRAIQAFHTMCDRENPLVEGAVYILTIILRGEAPEFKEPTKFIEDQLTNRFINKVPVEKLQPLITRITDGPVIPVKPELTLTGCPL